MTQARPRSVSEERIEVRLRRFRSDPLKFQLIQSLWAAPRTYDVIVENLGVEEQDTRRALQSLLSEGLVAERHAGDQLVYQISANPSPRAFVRQLLKNHLEDEAVPPA